MKIHPSQILRQAIAAWMSAAGEPAADIHFNFQRGNAPWWFLERLNGCGFLIFGFIAVNGRRLFLLGDGLNLSGKLPAAWRRRNRHVVGIAPVWRRGIKNPAPSLEFQKTVFTLARLFSRCTQCQPFWALPLREAARKGIARVLRVVRLKPDCPLEGLP